MAFEPLEYAQNQLAPLLGAIVASVEAEQKPDQERFFGAILRAIEGARDATDLAEFALSVGALRRRSGGGGHGDATLLDELLGATINSG